MSDNYSVTVRIAGTNQLSMPAGQAQQSLRGLNQEAQRTNQTLSQLKSVGMGLFAGVTLAGTFRMAEDMYQAGVAAQRAEMLYRSFGAQIGDTDALLERLRRTTRGVVDDVELMNAANSMLSMGLAKNATDVERLMDIGVTFAQAMGQDVGASLENLNMILANQSYLRLDSLGISSSQVRELAQQYQRAGMDSSEAFTAAFLDVAEGKLPQMSMVADATVTEFEKLSVAAGNWWTDVQERFATGVNTMVDIAKNGGILIRAALFGDGSAQAGNTAATDPMIGTIANAQADLMRQGLGIGLDARRGGIGSLMGWALNNGGSLGDMGLGEARTIMRQPLMMDYQVQALLESARYGLEQYNNAIQWAADSQEAIAVQTDQLAQAMAGGGFSVSPVATDPMAAERGGMMNSANVWMQAIRAQMGRNASPFMTGSDAYSVGQAAGEVQRVVDEMMRLNEVNPGFLSEQNVEMLSQMAAEASATADQAERMARAFENASLSQLFGQTGGGRPGEIGGGLLSVLQAQGLDGDALKSLQDALFLNSGQETQASLQYRDEVLPMIADIYTQFGQDAAVTAINAYNDAVSAAALAGQGSQPLDLTAALGYSYTMPGMGQPFTVNPGDTPSAVAARTGMSIDQVLAATGAANAYSMPAGTFGMAGGGDLVQVTQDAADNIAKAADNATGVTDEMSTAVDTLSSGIEGVFSKTYQLPIELVISGGGILGQLIAAAVAGNGGTTPGSTQNGGRSNAGTRSTTGPNTPTRTP